MANFATFGNIQQQMGTKVDQSKIPKQANAKTEATQPGLS